MLLRWKRCFLLLSVLFFFTSNGFAKIITPNEVYSQVSLIRQKVEFLKKHFGIKTIVKPKKIHVYFQPHHVWQKTYEVLVKINILRSKHNLPSIAVNSLEPILKLNSALAFEQTQRILNELNIFEFRLDIPKKKLTQKKFSDKTPTDVFNQLNFISALLDSITGTGFTPSHTFAQAMRVYEDVVAILHAKDIDDSTISPNKKKNITPAKVFEQCLLILSETNRLKLTSGISRTDFSGLQEKKITPTEVFGAMELILAELQLIKASIGLRHETTPPAKWYEGKKPADVQQVLGWTLRKLKLIQKL